MKRGHQKQGTDSHRLWGDYTSDGSFINNRNWGAQLEGYEEEDGVTVTEPILMLPTPSLYLKWVIKKVAEVKRMLGCAFRGLGD